MEEEEEDGGEADEEKSESGRMESCLKVSKFFQLDLFWQLTGEASYYEEIKGKNLFLIQKAIKTQVSETIWRARCFEIIMAWSLLCDTEVEHTTGCLAKALPSFDSYTPSSPPSSPSDRNSCPGLGFGR